LDPNKNLSALEHWFLEAFSQEANREFIMHTATVVPDNSFCSGGESAPISPINFCI
jgi:hypothetical protein